MENQFDVKRYKELLELEKTNKISFLDLELVTYQASIPSQISYNRKENYFSFIETYLKGTIDGYLFRSKFLEMENQDAKIAYRIRQDFQKLEAFTLADDLEEFSSLTQEISTLCEEYDEIWDGTIIPMSESEFYSLVNKHYYQLAKSFPQISTKNLPYEKLISGSFQNLGRVLIFGISLIFFNISNELLIGF